MKRTTIFAGVALLLTAVLIEVRALSDQGCGSTKTCIRFPVGCSPTQADCHFFSYSWDESSSSFTMELSGGSGSGSTYMAVGFAPNPTMEKADMYYCTGTALKTGVIQGLRQMPYTDPVLAASVSEQQASTNSGVAECTFTRQANISRVVSAADERINFDLSTESFYVLLASGDVSGGQMQYHGVSRWASSSAYNFTSPPANATSGITSGCNVTKKCYTSQAGCSPGTANCVFVSWKYKAASRAFDIELSGVTSGYVALAFATLPSMADADLYYCTSGGLKTGVIGQLYSQPEVEATLSNGVQSGKVTSTGGLVTCSFTRPASVTKEPNGVSTTFDLVANNFHILTSTGELSGGTIQYHGFKRWVSTQSFNYTEGFGDSTTTDVTPTAESFAFKLQNTPNCTPGTVNCITLSWNYDASSESFQMRLSGKPSSGPAYVAAAFASNNLMQDADLYYCSGDAFGSGALREQYNDPVFGASLTHGVTAGKRSATNGVYTCDFTRAASLVKMVSEGANKTFDLATNSYYALFATGQYFSGALIYHFETRWVSPEAINFITGTVVGGVATTTSLAIVPPTSGGITSECGLSAECARSSPSCKPESDSTCIVLTWTYLAASDSFDMTVSGKATSSQYIAVGFASSGVMQDVDVYICTESSLISGAIGSRYSSPVAATLSSAGITSDSANSEDGMLTCSFTRPANVTRTVSSGPKDFDLTTTSFFVLFAKGSTFAGDIYYHDTRSNTASQVNFLSGFSTPATPITSTSLAGGSSSPATTLPVCGGATRCVTNIADCTPGTAACLQLAWTYDRAAGSFDMVLTGADAGGNRYVAVAFASSGSMQDSDLYYCTTSGLGTGALTEQYTPPVVDASRPVQITQASYSAIDGVMQCRFTRSASVSRLVGGNVTKNFDLVNENYFILMATSYYFGEIIYHESNRWVIPNTNFTSVEPSAITSTSLSMTSSSPSPATTLPVCGGATRCATNTADCTPGTAACLQLAWTYDRAAGSFDMVLTGADAGGNRYVAVAFASSGSMQDSDLYYCTTSGLGTGALTEQYTPPVVDASRPAQITQASYSAIDGVMQCRFTRSASVSRLVGGNVTKNFDLVNENYFILMATSYYFGEIIYHELNRWVVPKTNFTSVEAPSTTSEPTTTTVSAVSSSTVPRLTSTSTTPAYYTTQAPTTTPTQPAPSVSVVTPPASTTTHQSLPVTSSPAAPASFFGCGSTKNCSYYSTNCKSSSMDSCDYAAWSYNAATNSFEFEINGEGPQGSYVAVALTTTGKMERAEMYYCTSSELKSGVIRALQSSPVVDSTLAAGISNVRVQYVDGLIQCKFTRDPSVLRQLTARTKRQASGGPTAFDLKTTNYYTLMAKGRSSGGNIQYHFANRNASDTPLSFMSPGVPATNTTGDGAEESSSVSNAISMTPATSLTPSSTPPVNSSGSECGETKSCFQFPPGCLQGTADCIFVTWQFDPVSKMVLFDISGATSGQYAAFALSPEGIMENSDLYYCTGTSLKSGELRGRHQPPVTNAEPLPVSNAVAEVKDGVLQCSFSRPISVTKEIEGGKFDFDVAKQEFYMLVAGGSLVQGENPVNHGGRKAVSGLKINFTALSNVKSAPTPSYKQVLVKFHAALMILAWLTCASIGVLIARHFKPLWHDTTCFGGKVWFQVHRSFMMIAVLATIVAFILIFVSVGGYSSNAGAHPIIGIVVTALAIINPVMAIFRPHPDAPKRPVFNWGHWFVGLCAHTLSVVAIFLGIDLPRLDLDRWLTWLMIAFVIFHIATEIIMEILSAKYGHIAAYKKKNKTNAMKLEDRNGDSDDTPPKQTAPKGTGIKFAVLGIYSLGNFVFFLIFIVAIARHG